MDNVSLSRTSPAPAAQNIVKDNKEKPSSNEFKDALKDEVKLNEASQVVDKKEAKDASVDDEGNEPISQSLDDNNAGESAENKDVTEVVRESLDEVIPIEWQPQGNDLPVAAIVGSALNVETGKKPSKSDVQLSDSVATKRTLELTADVSKTQRVQKPISQLAQEGEEVSVKLDNKFQIDSLKNLLANKNASTEKAVEIKLNTSSSAVQLSLASQQQQVPNVNSLSSINGTVNNFITDGNSLSLAPPLQASVATPVQNPAWPQSLVDKLSLMVNGQLQRAEIKLNPANLGSMDIQLSIKDDQASVNFVSPHAQVREAIDQAIPRLRDMLEQQGLSLVDVDVSQYSDQQQGDAESSKSNQAKTAQENSMEGENESVQVQKNIQLTIESGVSIYA